MKINTGILETNAHHVGVILNTLLSDEYLLYTKTLNYHWNVKGIQFNDLHIFFEKQYEDLFEIIDATAERARSVGVRSLGTMNEFINSSRLQEHDGVIPSAQDMIKNLLTDHETIIRAVRIDLESCIEKYHDAGTNNFLTDLMEKHEKMAWMLRSFLQ